MTAPVDPPEPVKWRGDLDPCLNWDAADRARDARIADQLEGR